MSGLMLVMRVGFSGGEKDDGPCQGEAGGADPLDVENTDVSNRRLF